MCVTTVGMRPAVVGQWLGEKWGEEMDCHGVDCGVGERKNMKGKGWVAFKILLPFLAPFFYKGGGGGYRRGQKKYPPT